MTSTNFNDHALISKRSFFQLKLQREEKEERIKSLQRNHNYKMMVLGKKWKQKIQNAEKERKRDEFLQQKRNFSHQILRLKKEVDKNAQKKNACLKQSVEFHRQQKLQNITFMTQGIMKGANMQRFEQTFYHRQIQRQKKNSYLYKRRLYQKQRRRQAEKKKCEQSKREHLRTISRSNLEQRIITEQQKIQELQSQYNVKRTFFSHKIRKAVDEYNRLNLN